MVDVESGNNNVEMKPLVDEEGGEEENEFTNNSWNNSDFVDHISRARLEGPNDSEWRNLVNSLQTSDLVIPKDRSSDLIVLLAESGLDSYMKILLDAGADPNITHDFYDNAPQLAASLGYAKVLQVFVDYIKKEEVNYIDMAAHCKYTGENILHAILKKGRQDHGQNYLLVDYESCLKIVLDNSKLFKLNCLLNRQNNMGNSPMHYAVHALWPEEIIFQLMIRGANLTIKNFRGDSLLSLMSTESLEKYFNEHCVIHEGSPLSGDFSLTFKFDNLMYTPDCGYDDPTQVPFYENGLLKDIYKEDSHRSLANHPLIRAYFNLKWSKVAWLYFMNIVFYLVFVIILTTYIFSKYAGSSLGVQFPKCPGNDTPSELNNETLSVAETQGPLSAAETQDPLWYATTLLLVLLIVREFLQMFFTPQFNSKHRVLRSVFEYFSFDTENLLEVATIVLTSILLFDGSPGCLIPLKRNLSATVLLLSWVQLLTLLGRSPIISDYNSIYLTIFYRILRTFVIILIWYSLYILGFALGFYILLHKDDGGPPPTNFPTAPFDRLDTTLLKAFTMFTGEYEFSALPITTTFDGLFLFVFIVMTAIVLMNTLNGLAVTDTAIILAEAESVGNQRRVDALEQMEWMFAYLNKWGMPDILGMGHPVDKSYQVYVHGRFMCGGCLPSTGRFLPTRAMIETIEDAIEISDKKRETIKELMEANATKKKEEEKQRQMIREVVKDKVADLESKIEGIQKTLDKLVVSLTEQTTS